MGFLKSRQVWLFIALSLLLAWCSREGVSAQSQPHVSRVISAAAPAAVLPQLPLPRLDLRLCALRAGYGRRTAPPLETPVTIGSRFDDWEVCWLGGWTSGLWAWGFRLVLAAGRPATLLDLTGRCHPRGWTPTPLAVSSRKTLQHHDCLLDMFKLLA